MKDRTRTQVVPSYFGKIPSRPDFIESLRPDYPLVRRVDGWVSECIHAGGKHAGWDRAYDAAPPVYFLAVSSASHSVALGALRASGDASGRRYPLIGMVRIETPLPIEYAPMAPFAFHQAWKRIDDGLDRTLRVSAHEPTHVTTGWPCVIMTSRPWLRTMLDDYAASENSQALDASLASAGHAATAEGVVLSLARLFATVSAHPDTPLGRGLILPLPADPLRQPRVMALWLDLILATFGKRPVEVVAVVTCEPRPRLIVSFDSTRGSELLAAWMPAATADRYVDLTAAQPDQPLIDSQPPPSAPLAPWRRAFLNIVKDTRPCAA